MNVAEEYSQLTLQVSHGEEAVQQNAPAEAENLSFPEIPDDDIVIFKPGTTIHFPLGNPWGTTLGVPRVAGDVYQPAEAPPSVVAMRRGGSRVNRMSLYLALSSNPVFVPGENIPWNTLGAQRVLFRASSSDILVGEARLAAWKVWREAMTARGVPYSKLVATQESKVADGGRARPR